LAGSARAAPWPPTPCTPAPGGAEAPATYRPRMGVRPRNSSGAGRKQSCWSSSKLPPARSPPARLGFSSLSWAGERMARARTSLRKPGAKVDPLLDPVRDCVVGQVGALRDVRVDVQGVLAGGRACGAVRGVLTDHHRRRGRDVPGARFLRPPQGCRPGAAPRWPPLLDLREMGATVPTTSCECAPAAATTWSTCAPRTGPATAAAADRSSDHRLRPPRGPEGRAARRPCTTC
jgi:hypothetical protein